MRPREITNHPDQVASQEQTKQWLQEKTDKKLRKLLQLADKKCHPFIRNVPGGIKHLVSYAMIRNEIRRREGNKG